ncbi:MAG: LPS export ABC transporter periplasmic protein LptC [Methylophaga sp.]|nr:LPS export ABC transporter periplasmic protein LptC [Methylophaga sp.]
MNAISNIPFFVKLTLVVVALVTAWLFLDRPAQEPIERRGHRTTDYTMTNFTMTVMNDHGKPSRIIRGEEMAHYPDDDSTEILIQTTDFLQEGKDTWIVSSHRADTSGEGEIIILTGNVVITNEQQPETQLLTEILHLDTVENTAYTDQPVSMKSLHGYTDSVGLHAILNERIINLHSRVRGQYDAPPQN